jgi:hypothetical protein
MLDQSRWPSVKLLSSAVCHTLSGVPKVAELSVEEIIVVLEILWISLGCRLFQSGVLTRGRLYLYVLGLVWLEGA